MSARDDLQTAARKILREDFSFDHEVLGRASDALRDAGAQDDDETFAYWRSVFDAVLDLWGERECDETEYHLIQTIGSYAAGIRDLTDEELAAGQKTTERAVWIHKCAQGEMSVFELAEKLGCSVDKATELTQERIRRQLMASKQDDDDIPF